MKHNLTTQCTKVYLHLKYAHEHSHHSQSTIRSILFYNSISVFLNKHSVVWKPTEIPAVTHHQYPANFQRSSFLFSSSMAQAIFFPDNNLDVCINLLLFFACICNVELQTHYFVGRKSSLKVCAGPHFILLLFQQSKYWSAMRVCKADFAFQLYMHHWIFCKADITII